jgi:hypothetical protein
LRLLALEGSQNHANLFAAISMVWQHSGLVRTFLPKTIVLAPSGLTLLHIPQMVGGVIALSMIAAGSLNSDPTA